MRRALLIVLMALAGCSATFSIGKKSATTKTLTLLPKPITTDTIALSENIADGARFWKEDFIAKFHREPVIVCVHGADCGTWRFCPDNKPSMDAAGALWMVRIQNPGRPILVLSCNPGGYPIDVPDCWYAKRSIWSRPRADAQWNDLTMGFDVFIGNLDEFTHNP